MRTMTTSKGETFTTDLTDAEALAVVREHGAGNFARSLVQQAARRALSSAQLPYLHKLAKGIMDAAVRNASACAAANGGAPAPAADAFALPIHEMMTRAAGVVRFPKITFDLTDSRFERRGAARIMFSVASARSRYPGRVFVTDGGRYGQNVFYGSIDANGVFYAAPAMAGAAWVEAEMRAIAQNPAGYAAAYGRRVGSCCFCRRALTDARSTSVGYGPVCAETFGMPWGAVDADTFEAAPVATVAA